MKTINKFISGHLADLNRTIVVINIPIMGLVIALMMFRYLTIGQYEVVKASILALNLGLIVTLFGWVILLTMQDGCDRDRLFLAGFFAWIAGVVIFKHLFGDVPDIAHITRVNLYVLYAYGVYWLVGYAMQPADDKLMLSLLVSLWIAIGLLIMLHLDPQQLQIDRRPIPASAKGAHLLLADIYAILALIIVGSLRNTFARWSVFFLSSLIIFMIGSRTSLYAFFITLPILLIILHDGRSIVMVLGYTAILSAGMILLLGIDSIMNHRMLRYIFTGECHSLSDRFSIFHEGMHFLKGHLVCGEYAGQLDHDNGFGMYIHNYFSLWRQFGLMPFALFVYFMARMGGLCVSFLRRGIPSSGREVVFVLLFVFNLTEILFSRSYIYPLVFISIGMWLSLEKGVDRKAGPALPVTR